MSFADIRDGLKDRNGYAYKFLFDPVSYGALASVVRPLAASELFQRAKDLAVEITFVNSETDWAIVKYVSTQLKSHVSFGFVKKDGQWFFADGDWFCNSV